MIIKTNEGWKITKNGFGISVLYTEEIAESSFHLSLFLGLAMPADNSSVSI
jgi:hypothetical protein